jgi:hypothetical protein
MLIRFIGKVLWDPTWGGRGLEIGGLLVLQTAVLVLFWYPFMALTVPVIVGENLLTTWTETLQALPGWMRAGLQSRWGRLAAAAGLGIWCGLCQMGGAPSLGTALVADVSALAVLFLLGALWRRVNSDLMYPFRDLLPAGREAYVLAGLLLLNLLSTFGIRPASLPRTIVPHFSVWILYAPFAGLLWANTNVSANAEVERSPSPYLSAPRFGISFAVFLVLTASTFAGLKRVGPFFTIFSYLVGLGLGCLLLVLSILRPIQLRVRV